MLPSTVFTRPEPETATGTISSIGNRLTQKRQRLPDGSAHGFT